jgi:hypothetical protein
MTGNKKHDQHVTPVILCGGSGTRLWPLSRKSFPMQRVPLFDNKCLLLLKLEWVAQINGYGTSFEMFCVASQYRCFMVAEAIQATKLMGKSSKSRWRAIPPSPWRWQPCSLPRKTYGCFATQITIFLIRRPLQQFRSKVSYATQSIHNNTTKTPLATHQPTS